VKVGNFNMVFCLAIKPPLPCGHLPLKGGVILTEKIDLAKVFNGLMARDLPPLGEVTRRVGGG